MDGVTVRPQELMISTLWVAFIDAGEPQFVRRHDDAGRPRCNREVPERCCSECAFCVHVRQRHE